MSQLQPSDLEYNSNSDSSLELYSSSDSDSDSSLGADILPPPSPSLSPDILPTSEPSNSRASTPNPKQTIRARIQALTYLELSLPHFQITAKIGVSKAQVNKLREKALSRR
jgi:hypothetical protein